MSARSLIALASLVLATSGCDEFLNSGGDEPEVAAKSDDKDDKDDKKAKSDDEKTEKKTEKKTKKKTKKSAKAEGADGDPPGDAGEKASEDGPLKFKLSCKITSDGETTRLPFKHPARWEGTIKCGLKRKSGAAPGPLVGEVWTAKKGKPVHTITADIHDGTKDLEFMAVIPQYSADNQTEYFTSCSNFGLRASVKTKEGEQVWKGGFVVKADCGEG